MKNPPTESGRDYAAKPVTQFDAFQILLILGEWADYDTNDPKSLTHFSTYVIKEKGLAAEHIVAVIEKLQKSGDVNLVRHDSDIDIQLTALGAERAEALKQLLKEKK